MKKSKYKILTLLALFLSACSTADYFDIDEVELKGKIEPEWILPAVKVDLSLEDMVDEQQDTIEYVDAGDGSGRRILQYVYRDTEIASFSTDDMYEEPELPSVTETIDIGSLTIGNQTKSQTIPLDDLVTGMQAGAGKTILTNAINSGVAIPISPFPSVPAGNVEFPGIDALKEARFGSGTVKVSLENNMPIPITIVLDLYNKNPSDPSKAFVDRITFTNIPPNSVGKKDVDLAGKTLTNELEGRIMEFSSSGSTTPVMLNGSTNNFKLTVDIISPVVKSGLAKLPGQDLPSRESISEFGEGDMKFKELKFKTADATFTITSDLKLKLNFKLTFPAVINGGQPKIIEEVLDFTRNRTVTINRSFAGDLVNLGTGSKGYNEFPIKSEAKILPTTDYVQFTNTDKFSLKASFANIDFEYVKGNFGKETFDVEASTFNIEDNEVLDKMDGKVTLLDPSFKFFISNKGIGVPLSLDFNLKRKNGVGVKKTIDFQPADNFSTTVEQTVILDKNTDNFIDLLALPFEELTYSASGGMNPNNETSLDQFVTGDAKVKIGAEITLPFHLKIENLSFSDTIESDINQEGETIKQLDKIKLIAKIENGFPFNVGLKLNFLHKKTEAVLFQIDPNDSEGLVLKAAEVVDGVVPLNKTTSSSFEIELTKDQIDKLQDVDNIEIKALLYTANNEGVKVYADYKIAVVLALSASGSIDLAELDDE